ncbi:4Fe-4S ferredoxin [Spirochaetia bacterium]|nr:4Fe-4S ferredoxin [Spirochaetia bacterium]
MAKKGKIVLDRELCKGCFLCVRACPVHVLDKDTTANSTGTYPASVVNPDACIACGNCFAMCPDVCIEIFEL